MTQPKSHQQTREQERAKSAWEAIAEVEKKDDKQRNKYGTLARGLPATILRDGLGPTVAFLQAKGEAHHKLLYTHLSQWIKAALKPQGYSELAQHLRDCSSAEYRMAATEVLAYQLWLKRYVEAKGWHVDRSDA